MSNKLTYGYATITCKQRVRFPSFLKTLHIQGEENQAYTIECYSFAELRFYDEMCKAAPELFAPPEIKITSGRRI